MMSVPLARYTANRPCFTYPTHSGLVLNTWRAEAQLCQDGRCGVANPARRTFFFSGGVRTADRRRGHVCMTANDCKFRNHTHFPGVLAYAEELPPDSAPTQPLFGGIWVSRIPRREIINHPYLCASQCWLLRSSRSGLPFLTAARVSTPQWTGGTNSTSDNPRQHSGNVISNSQ